MPRKRLRRPGLRALAAIAGIAGIAAAVLVGGSGASQASTVPGPVPHGAPGATPATFPYPTPCTENSVSCTYDSGWYAYSGNCEVDTIATWTSSSNVLDITVKMDDPNWFSSCTSYTTVYFELTPVQDEVEAGPYWGFACAALDPTCSNTQTWTYQASNVIPAADLAGLQNLYVIASSHS